MVAVPHPLALARPRLAGAGLMRQVVRWRRRRAVTAGGRYWTFLVGTACPVAMIVGAIAALWAALAHPAADSWLALPAFVTLLAVGISFLLDLGSVDPPDVA